MSKNRQINLLANYIVVEVPGAPNGTDEDEDVCSCAVRLLKEYRTALIRSCSSSAFQTRVIPHSEATAYEIAQQALSGERSDRTGREMSNMDWITVREAMEIANACRETVYNWCRRKEFSSHRGLREGKTGSMLQISRAEFVDFLARIKVHGNRGRKETDYGPRCDLCSIILSQSDYDEPNGSTRCTWCQHAYGDGPAADILGIGTIVQEEVI